MLKLGYLSFNCHHSVTLSLCIAINEAWTTTSGGLKKIHMQDIKPGLDGFMSGISKLFRSDVSPQVHID